MGYSPFALDSREKKAIHPMGTPFPFVISFATPEYEEHAGRLVTSLERFGLRHEVVRAGSRGSWVRNCNQKPEIIVRELAARGEPVLWLDADAEVVQYPALFEQAERATR